MRNLLKIVPMIFVSLAGYSQCDSNKVMFVDSLLNEVGAEQTYLLYNGVDTLYLDQFYDVDFNNLIGAFPVESQRIDSSGNYCIICMEAAIQIVDSIDLNNDGTKEVFLLRQWYCSATPSDVGPYGEGGQQLACSRYEVWDVRSETKIFEVKNMLYHQIAVTTSVVLSNEYQFDVSITQIGSLILSNLRGEIPGINPELGIYIYHKESNTYKKE